MTFQSLPGIFCAAFVAAALACPPVAAAAPEEGDVPQTSFDNYLAARFAAINRDTDAGADFYIRAVADDPFNIPLVHQAFSLAVASGRIDDAVRMARRLVDLKEKPTSLMELVLVVGDIKSGDTGKARAQVDTMNRNGIVALMAPLISAWLHADAGEIDLALADLDGLATSRGFEPFLRAHKAYILDFAGRIEDARVAYEEAVTLQKGTELRLVLSYGRFLERLGEADGAARVYADYVEQYPSNVLIEEARRRAAAKEKVVPLIGSVPDGVAEAFFSTGRALAQERSRSSAIVYMQLARALRDDFPVAGLLLGTILEQEGRDEAALEAYESVMRDPVLGWDARFEASMLLSRIGKADEAISELTSMAKAQPRDLTVVSALADILRTEEHYDAAKDYYDKAVGMVGNPSAHHWALFYSRGMTQERLGNWPAAEADFKKALELEPDQPLVLNYLGYTWIENDQNFEEALAMIERAVEQRPTDGYIVDSLGWALYRLGQYDEAVGWLEKAIELKPEDPTINDHLGDAYWQTGRRLEAGFQWRHALAMSPEESDAADIRKKITSGLDAIQHSGN